MMLPPDATAQRNYWIGGGVAIIAIGLATIVHARETNSLPTTPKPAIRNSILNGEQLAAQHERAGRKSEAAALYEGIARTNSAARKVLSHRLVAIYMETGETNKALVWAH